MSTLKHTVKLPNEIEAYEGYNLTKEIRVTTIHDKMFRRGDKDFWYWICMGLPATWGTRNVWWWAVDPIKTGGNDE